MNDPGGDLKPLDFEPRTAQFREEVLAGLRSRPKTLPCKYLYDEAGSRLFDRICELDEYYPTRTEMAILRERIGEIAAVLGPDDVLIEYGSGSSTKIRILLDALDRLAAYIPIDISCDHLQRSAEDLAASYPDLPVLPVCADYTGTFALPPVRADAARKIVFFPGSTIGNFEPEEAVGFLRGIAAVVDRGGGLLIGVDLKKDRAVLEAAYNDAEGVTAAFNLNLLHRINRELEADFDPDRFRHEAIYSEEHGRIEMHLVSTVAQTVTIDGIEIRFEAGETVHTESSYKYAPEEFAALAGEAGFAVERFWTDAKRLFSIQYLVVA
ncbi:MAG: L-histidine N(alpha)-methyltransferase [Candidatus Eisenbacteria bacterium]|nr:L-histidine N(alpha)-methyltransferase [Candidatus Latescibacterota bacterium]MBD3301873.1 L-histidine N(alpha)-methyltransferase [Candidatus Eisenbacteria bacterium]